MAVASVAVAGAITHQRVSDDTTRTIALDMSAATAKGSSPMLGERLSGLEEDPLALSTSGTGTFRLKIDAAAQELS